MRADAPIFVPSFLKEQPNDAVKSNEKRTQRKGRKKNKNGPSQRDEFHKGNVNNPNSRLITRRKQKTTKNKGMRNGKKRGGTDSDAIDVKDSIAFEDMFPSLIKENFDTTRRGKPIKSGSNWSRVALDGQIKSEKAKADEMREKLRLQHELETFTRLEVLKSSQHVVTSDADSNEMVENDKRVEQNMPYVRIMNMEKLRQRWMMAYEEKRKKDEEYALENKRQELLASSHQCQQESVLIDSTENHGSDIKFVKSDAVIDNAVSSGDLGSEMKNIEKYLECPFPLHAAVLNHDESAIVNLLSLPSDVTLRDTAIPISSLLSLRNIVLPTPFSRLGKTCSLVQLAVMLHEPNVLRLLLSKAVNRSQENSSFAQQLENLDDFHRTPLMFACEFALDGCINILLSFGAKVSTKHRKSGDTPLHIACHKGNIYSAAILLKSICPRDESSSANKRVESARLKLLSNRNVLGETPMHIICKTNNVQILDSIVDMCNASSIGKLLDIEDENGNTPLMLAIASGAEDIVMNLIHRHHVHKLHSCPLIAAVESKSLDMVRILMECRSILTLTDIDCDGALCSALSSFQGQGEDLENICKILIAEGANPHAKTILRDASERSHSESALTIAALQGDEGIVTTLLTCYDQYLVQKMKSLHVDPVLLHQSKSYFQAIEDKDKIEVQASMRDCIVRIIMSEAQSCDDDFKHRLKCCVRIFRRNLTLDNTSFARILKSLGAIPSKHCAVSENPLLDECIFRASYDLESKELPFNMKKNSSLYDDQFPDHDSSNLLFQLNWIIDEWRNMSLSCPWIQNKLFKVDGSNSVDDRDLCILVVEGMHYKAHKSILKRRSGKFSAAISFHEMRHKIDCHKNDDMFMISLDISKELLRLLIEHIYHGSIISELSCHSNACCEQLFDLYFVAQEYMCPTLAQEIEMRLLSSDPYFCSCWNCCMFNETSTNDEYQCFYQVKVRYFLYALECYLRIRRIF